MVGDTGMRVKRWDSQFVTYAGPWAEARAQWLRDSLIGLDSEDEDGYLFSDYVLGAFLLNRDGDADDYHRLESGVSDDGVQFDMPTTVKAQLFGCSQQELIADREHVLSGETRALLASHPHSGADAHGQLHRRCGDYRHREICCVPTAY
jgi:hypothetical protein